MGDEESLDELSAASDSLSSWSLNNANWLYDETDSIIKQILDIDVIDDDVTKSSWDAFQDNLSVIMQFLNKTFDVSTVHQNCVVLSFVDSLHVLYTSTLLSYHFACSSFMCLCDCVIGCNYGCNCNCDCSRSSRSRSSRI